MGTIVPYVLSSDDSSSDEGESLPRKKLRTDLPSPQEQTGGQVDMEEVDMEEVDIEEEQVELEVELDLNEAENFTVPAHDQALTAGQSQPEEEEQEDEQEREQEEQEELISASPAETTHPVTIDQPPRKIRKQSYAMNEKELPRAMRKFLQEVKTFFTRQLNLERQAKALATSTYQKAQERVLCFLGFLKTRLKMEIQPEVFLRARLIETYLDFLREDRQLSPATVSNHCSSLLYPAKFLHRESAPDYRDIPVIKQLRTQATILQRLGDLERPQTKEELTCLNRWLDWEQIVNACGLQRDYFEMAVNKREKAKECCDLVILAMYVFIPPNRGVEIRSLEIQRNWREYRPSQIKGKNVLLVKDTDEVTLYFQNYKTAKSSGRDELTLQGDHELCKILLDFVNNHRPQLLGRNSGDILLLNRNGEKFSCSAFSAHIKNLFHKLTGTVVTVNMIRSSFVTWAYGREDCSDALKASLAAALRHSRNQAEKTYDRRMANQRKEQAVSVAREYAQDIILNPGTTESTDTSHTLRVQPPVNTNIKVAQFVALIEEGSTLGSPKILVGQVHALLPDGRVSLLWYKSHKNFFKLELDGEQWIEHVNCLLPVSMRPVKNRPGIYRLVKSLRSIHRSLADED